MDGKIRDAWGPTSIRITDLAVTPDYKHLVAIGMESTPAPSPPVSSDAPQSRSTPSGDIPSNAGGNRPPAGGARTPHMMIIFDLATKKRKSCVSIYLLHTVSARPRRAMHSALSDQPSEGGYEIDHVLILHRFTGPYNWEGNLQACRHHRIHNLHWLIMHQA